MRNAAQNPIGQFIRNQLRIVFWSIRESRQVRRNPLWPFCDNVFWKNTQSLDSKRTCTGSITGITALGKRQDIIAPNQWSHVAYNTLRAEMATRTSVNLGPGKQHFL